MAGSYKHIIDKEGKLLSNEDFINYIENLGDAYEMAEECYEIIQILSNGKKDKIENAIKKMYNKQYINNRTPVLYIDKNTKMWKLPNGYFHREDGPAIEYENGTKHWYLNGFLHREDGPAIVDNKGNKQWYLNGFEVSKKKHKRKTKSS